MRFHEEQRFGWWIFAVLTIIALPIVVGTFFVAVLSPGPIVPVLLTILVLFALLLVFALAKLVVDVDERGIHVSFHFLWPTRDIRFEDIKTASATTYNSLLDYGGWVSGFRRRVGRSPPAGAKVSRWRRSTGSGS